MSSISDFHDSFCSCWHPFAHLLDIIFPEGHRDRKNTVEFIIERDIQCHSGGDGEENLGLENGEENQGEPTEKDEKPIKPDTTEEDLALAAAVADAER